MLFRGISSGPQKRARGEFSSPSFTCLCSGWGLCSSTSSGMLRAPAAQGLGEAGWEQPAGRLRVPVGHSHCCGEGQAGSWRGTTILVADLHILTQQGWGSSGQEQTLRLLCWSCLPCLGEEGAPVLPGLAAAGSCQGIMRLLGIISRGAGPEGAAAVPGALWECRAQDELTGSSARLAPNPARPPGCSWGHSRTLSPPGGCGGERRKMSFRGSSRV